MLKLIGHDPREVQRASDPDNIPSMRDSFGNRQKAVKYTETQKEWIPSCFLAFRMAESVSILGDSERTSVAGNRDWPTPWHRNTLAKDGAGHWLTDYAQQALQRMQRAQVAVSK